MLNPTSELIFVSLSDGSHQWPNADDRLPFNANIEVLRFFAAHYALTVISFHSPGLNQLFTSSGFGWLNHARPFDLNQVSIKFSPIKR